MQKLSASGGKLVNQEILSQNLFPEEKFKNKICSPKTCQTKIFQYKESSNSWQVPDLDEMSINLLVNDVVVTTLLDSGAQSSLLSFALANKIFSKWRSFPECKGPNAGIGVNGASFRIFGTKMFNVRIGNKERRVPISVTSIDCGMIMGLNLLKEFEISVHFHDKIQIFCGEYFLQNVYNEKRLPTLFAPGINKVVLNKHSTAMYNIDHECLEIGQDYIITSHVDYPSLSIPCVATADANGLNIPLNNSKNKKICFKPKELGFSIQKVSDSEIVGIRGKLPDNVVHPSKIPIVHYNKECSFNEGLYTPVREEFTRINYLNGIFSRHGQERPERPDKSSMAYLEELNGFDLPELHFPIRTPKQVVEDDVKGLSKSQKEFLIEEFTLHESLVAKFSYDAGVLTDINGVPIEMHIKLKSPLPKMTKSYKLSESEIQQVDSILDFLIFYGLAKEAELGKQYGSPVFLVPRANTQRGGRLVFDVRNINNYIEDSVATHSETCLDSVKNVLENMTWISQYDIQNAYFSIMLDKETLDTGISQVFTPTRVIQFRGALTGISSLPVFWANTVSKQLSLNDDGSFDPLNRPGRRSIQWFDDIVIASKGSENEHKQFMCLIHHRLQRLGVRLNLKKCTFFQYIPKATFSILGFGVANGRLIPNEERLDVLRAMPTPKSRTELQRFLGFITYLRALLPSKIVDLTTVISPLTSVNVKFSWEVHHNRAFEGIKEMLCQATAYNETRHENSICIIFTDASESLMAGIAFSYSLNDVLVDTPNHVIEIIDQEYYNHFKHYNICCKVFPQVSEPNIFKNFMFCLLSSTNMYQMINPDNYHIQEFLNEIYRKFSVLRGLFRDLEEMNTFIEYITKETFNEDLFHVHIHHLIMVCSVLLGKNIKIVFGVGRHIKTPFMVLTDTFSQDVLLGYSPERNEFSLFYVENDFLFESWTLRSNRRGCVNSMSKNQILDNFMKNLKIGKMNKNVRLTSQFSKAFAKPDRASPIYIKESLALLQGLSYFNKEIKETPLTLLLTDSKIATFLFNRDVQNSSKKLMRWSLKLQLDFPEIVILHVSGSNNIADFLSRLGMSKREFFERTLTPLRLNKELRNVLPEHYGWKELIKILDDNPKLIDFSSKKIDTKLQNAFFVDDDNVLELTNVTKELSNEMSYNTIRTFITKTNYLNGYLARQKIIKEQFLEDYSGLETTEINGLVFKGELPILPEALYIFLGLREHLIAVHAGFQALLMICKDMFFFVNIKLLKTVLKKICDSCMTCCLNKIKMDKNPHGSFKVNKSCVAIQIDLIESLVSRYKHILVVIDVYSRMIQTFPLVNKSAQAIQQSLLVYLQNNPLLRYIVSDNATIFRNRAMTSFYKKMGIINPSSGAYKSRARGLVENANLLLQRAIIGLISGNREDWYYELPLAVFLLNHKRFYGERLSAANIHFGSNFMRQDIFRKEQMELFRNNIPEDFQKTEARISRLLEEEEEKLLHERLDVQERRIKRANKSKKSIGIPQGTYVVLKRRYIPVGVSPKLLSPYEKELYKVIFAGKFNIAVENILSGITTVRPRMDVKPLNIEPGESDTTIDAKARRLLELLTEENIIELFNNPPPPAPTKRVTRQGPSNEETEEIQELQDRLMDDLLDFNVQFDDAD